MKVNVWFKEDNLVIYFSVFEIKYKTKLKAIKHRLPITHYKHL